MSKYKIGITEAGDAGLDLTWEGKLPFVDGTILITKNPRPQFLAAVMRNQEKIILHITITGYGGTAIEPNVPIFIDTFHYLKDLVRAGFPQNKIVIRVDPIIPTDKGIQKAFDMMAGSIDEGFTRFRVSIIDMYPHVRERFIASRLPLPYGDKGFLPSISQSKAVDKMLKSLNEYAKEKDHQIRIETCAEPRLKNAIQQGCISSYDLNLLGLAEDADNDNVGFQRKNCLCYFGKTELLANKERCPHQCLYCYWK